MNILPITYNTQIHNIKRNSLHNSVYQPNVTFCGTDNTDTFTMKTMLNSEYICKLIQQKKFKEAHDFITDSHSEYDPNYVDSKSQKPLLMLVAFSNSRGKTHKNDNKYKSMIIQDIICKDNFEPNKRFKIKHHGKFFDTTYVEQAVSKNNITLLLSLLNYSQIQDPCEDCWRSLTNIAFNKGYKNLQLLLSKMQDDYIDEELETIEENQNQNVEGSNKNSDSTKVVNKRGAELLDGAKVYISEDLPESIDNVGGLSSAKKDIENYIIKPWSAGTMERLRTNHISMPNGFLMYGPPGCGKTFITSVIAKQTGYPLYSINMGNIGSKWISETPQNLKNIFEELENRYKAEKKPSILLFDEIDDIGGSREDCSSGKREDLNALLMELNNAGERGIIVIGATNYPQGVDPALLRSGRFDKKIKIDLPTEEERKDILVKLLSKKEIAKNLLEYVDEIAKKTEGKTPADLAKYVNNASMLAIYDKDDKVSYEKFLKIMDEVDLSDKPKPIGFSK